MTRALADAVSEMGGIDVCVDIIGKGTWNKVEDFDDEEWGWTLESNLTQVFYLFQEASPHMINQGTGGSIVALASVDGIAAAYHVAYGAAKAGVISLAKTFGNELGRYGIWVNAVGPGAVGTGNEDWPEGEWRADAVNPLAPPRAHDIANAVLFLCSDLAARISGPDAHRRRRSHNPGTLGDGPRPDPRVPQVLRSSRRNGQQRGRVLWAALSDRTSTSAVVKIDHDILQECRCAGLRLCGGGRDGRG